ncbi:metal-dependent hydrolase [Candidatus Woesearchaeota archaeon]|nr:metal-dependent hydrolase [Candidatus Woesearchaeota archaeon]
MLPYTHFLFPFTISLLLVKLNIFTWEYAVLCGIIGVLIDIDHYVEHILNAKSKKFSLKATWNDSARFHRFNGWSFVHHWQGALVFGLVIAGIYFLNWKIALILGIGYYSHLLLDYANIKQKKFLRTKIDKFYFIESYLEVILDIILIILIIIFLII